MKIFLATFIILLFSSCQREKISLSATANDTFYVQNAGSSQRVQVRGNTLSGKIILTVHGGPGGSSYYLSYLQQMQRQIEPDFAVAYLDQPIAGASQGNRVKYSIDDYAEGIKKTIAVLKYRYGVNQKIILFSESWGGIVSTAFLTSGANQQLVAGWVNSGGPHDFHLQDREIIPMAIAEGNRQIALGKNVAKWQEIVSYCQNNSPVNNYTVAKKLNDLLGDAENLIDTVVKVDFGTIGIFWNQSLNNNAPFTAAAFNLFSNTKNDVEKEAYKKFYENDVAVISVPLLLLWGKYDFIAPPAVADSLFNKVQSGIKQKIILQRSGHNSFLQEPDIYWPAFKNFVRQL
jgi:pimeloyl-ACP methyl ester carboxylesterase